MSDPLHRSPTTGVRPRWASWVLEWILASVLAGSAAGVAHANPTGSTVVHGSVEFSNPSAGTLNVTASSNAIINWQGFSIGADELTRFIQPGTGSAVLNRVVGSGSSEILGRLLSNGRVFLVNPHGIVFGENASVDTAGLVASTLGISDADFLEGDYRFDAGPDAGKITNEGSIEAGAGGVFLLAPSVENSGVIHTERGDLVLAAGRTITLTSLDLGGVQVEVQAPEDEALNLGTLLAERGAAGVFAGSIRNAGTVEANAVTVDEDGTVHLVFEDGLDLEGEERGAAGVPASSTRNAGTVRLVAQEDITLEAGGRVAADGPTGGLVQVESTSGTTWISGDVSARGSTGLGGEIRLLGDQVGLDGARVDASGSTGGGEVLVGGDESGEGPVPTAQSAYVSADSTVSADALASGDGGKVVVFAEGFANVRGHLSARGGPDGGNGGFVETSGRESFEILNTPDTTAPTGEGGHWLIDPNDIEIVAGGGNVNLPDGDPFVSTGDGARLGIELLIAALSGGQSVTVRTSESGSNSQDGHIMLNTALDVESTTGTNTLVFDAHRSIEINQPISDTAGGAELNLVLDAGDVEVFNTHGIGFNADVTLRGGSLTTDADYVHIQNGATVILGGIRWQEDSRHFAISSGDGDTGTLILQNDASLEATSYINVAQEGGTGVLTIAGGSDVTTARGIGIGDGTGSEGTVTVAGSGSTLTTDEYLGVGNNGGTGTLTIESGADVMARWLSVGDDAGSEGTVTVTGSGSTLTTAGTDNGIEVGDEGSGVLEVRDGGLVETLHLGVARSGTGRAIISGVASDGTRSRVIVSPASGRYSGEYVLAGGYVRVARDAGSNGVLEILDGGLLRVQDSEGTFGPGFDLARNKGSVGRLRVDGEGSSLEIIQHGSADDLRPFVNLGWRGGGTTILSNGGRLLVQGERAYVGVSFDWLNPDFPDPDTGPLDQQSVVNILSEGELEIAGEGAVFVIGNGGPSADGMVTVSGPGSRIITRGTDNGVFVGDEGTGECRVLDGGLIDTLWFEVGFSGVGRATISGVAADGTRSRVIVSPANGKFSGDFVDEGGFARVARNAGSNGVLEILDGGLLRILDGEGTHGPELQIARNKGSVGRLVIDGAGSSLEVIQNGPAVHGNPHVSAGPSVALGRRGAGTTVIRNGGRLLVQGESAFVQVSRDSLYEAHPDPDAGPIDQRSTVNIAAGGRLEVDGEDALLVIGDGGPAADGAVNVTGSGSALITKGTNNTILVGDEGTGELNVQDGGLVRTLWFEVARSGVGRATLSGLAADGTRSRVIVSPADGQFGGIWIDFANKGSFAEVARNAGANGTLEILDGALFRVLGGNGTHGPEFEIARHEGSVGMLLIDGAGSSLEVMQSAPAVEGDPLVWPGPVAVLGRRGGGNTILRNGGRLVVQGERASVQVSQHTVFPDDSNIGAIDQQSVVRIESGGRMAVDGAQAFLVLGDDAPGADGVIIVTGAGSTLSVTGASNRLIVGDEGTGRLEVRDGGVVVYGELVVGSRGHTNLPEDTAPEDEAGPVDAPEVTDDILSTLPDEAAPGGSDAVAEEILTEDADAEEDGDQENKDDEDEEETGEDAGEAGEDTEEQEALPACP